nr:hypothetical protein [Tanacetum cinerariifolium]
MQLVPKAVLLCLTKKTMCHGMSRLHRYAKSRPNGKLIHNSIINGPYVRQMIPEPGDTNREIIVTETFHTILLGLPEDIYAAVDSYETAQEIWLRVQQMMKGSDIGIQKKKAKNKHFPEKIASNLKFLNNLQPEWSRHVTIVHQTKDMHTADYTQLYDFLKYNQKEEEAGIQLQAEEYDLMDAAADLDEIEEVNANCILMANLQQAMTSEETLQFAQESREKMKQLNKEIKPENYIKINHLSRVFVPQTTKSHEELYFSNISKTAKVSKSISIPNDDFSDDTTPSVARKFLNEVKSTIVTLQHVVKHRMTIEPHNWSSSAYQKLHKIIKDENFPIVNQVEARVQNFETQFLNEAAKFVGDFKSLANEADASLAKHKALELEIELLLKVVVSQDIMNIVHKESIVDTSDLQTELERTKERFENCIIKKENEYAKL